MLGEIIVLFANGFGGTSVPLVGGSPTQSVNLPSLPVFAGLVEPGLFQFNVVVPQSLRNADQSITATYNGISTQSGTLIPIHN
jgi:uncharacterized protein (TIGR03437 family)